jgi:catechol 2,3-dioxygenase-like lactoylglutathione lyase family enzyme
VSDRPALWVGHVALATHDIQRSYEFYRDLGLRSLREPTPGDGLVQLEMRGGTHLALVLDPNAKTEGRQAPFDLMPDDIDALHTSMEVRGILVSPMTRPEGDHAFFTFTDPDGYVVTVNSSHVEGDV